MRTYVNDTCVNILDKVHNAPTVENTINVYPSGNVVIQKRPQDELEDFAKFVAREVLDDYFEENAGAFAEIACRKLVKLGLIELKDNVYRMKGGAE